MVGVRLTPPFPFVVVGSPEYLRRRGRPERIDDLRQHACLRMRRSNGSIAPCSFPLSPYQREQFLLGRVAHRCSHRPQQSCKNSAEPGEPRDHGCWAVGLAPRRTALPRLRRGRPRPTPTLPASSSTILNTYAPLPMLPRMYLNTFLLSTFLSTRTPKKGPIISSQVMSP